MKRLTDVGGRELRLTEERLDHIERRPEMADQLGKVKETLVEPDEIRASDQDDTVRLFYRYYEETPVSEKYLLVVAKVEAPNPSIITAFFTDRIKSGRPADPVDDRD